MTTISQSWSGSSDHAALTVKRARRHSRRSRSLGSDKHAPLQKEQ
jgi:hypothetical protein